MLAILQADHSEPPDLFGRGPFNGHGYTIFQLSSNSFVPNDPIVAGERMNLNTSLTWVNEFNNETGRQLVDGELLRLDVDGWYGISDHWQVGVELPFYVTGGGYMDGFIDDFHRIFDIDGAREDRDSVSKYKFQTEANGTYNNWGSDILLGDLTLQARYNLPNISFGVKLQLPTSTSTDWYDHNGLAGGVDVVLHYKTGDWFFYGGFGVATLGDTEVIGQEGASTQVSGLVAIDWQILEDCSVVGQILTRSGSADFHQHSSGSVDATLGFRYKITNSTLLEVAATENMFRFENSADFGMHAGISWRF